MDTLTDSSSDTASSEQPATGGGNHVKLLQPYQRQLEQAKGVEAILNQGAQDRMHSLDGLENEN